MSSLHEIQAQYPLSNKHVQQTPPVMLGQHFNSQGHLSSCDMSQNYPKESTHNKDDRKVEHLPLQKTTVSQGIKSENMPF